MQLWRTDGTASGTVVLASLPNGFDGPEFESAALGSFLLFSAADDLHGQELWKSDGTPQGTGPLADLNTSDPGGSHPAELNALGDRVLFFANDGVHGYGLWKSDGTGAGTSLVREFIPGLKPDSSPFDSIAEPSGKNLFFILTEQGVETVLWRTDGTEGGTIPLTTGSLKVRSHLGFRAVGDTLFFVAVDEEHGAALWKSDGTPAGTVLVKDIEPGFDGSHPQNFTAFQGRLYFTVQDFDHGVEPWVSDGTRRPARTS